MRLSTRIFLAMAMLLAGIGAGVAMQPGHFRVTRSVTIEAPLEKVFNQVNDFRSWEAWSHWAMFEPKPTFAHDGPASGEGAVFRWSGNEEAGSGSMTIIESEPGDRIVITLVSVKPHITTRQSEFTFRQDEGQTRVTWTMTGNRNFAEKLRQLFADGDAIIGHHFEISLDEMKRLAEEVP